MLVEVINRFITPLPFAAAAANETSYFRTELAAIAIIPPRGILGTVPQGVYSPLISILCEFG